jgi:hypothetical protein
VDGQNLPFRKALGQLWAAAHNMIAICNLPMVNEEDLKSYLECVDVFVAYFKAMYGRDDFTPYMHLVCIHVPDMMRRWGTIELFGGYAIESRVCMISLLFRKIPFILILPFAESSE